VLKLTNGVREAVEYIKSCNEHEEDNASGIVRHDESSDSVIRPVKELNPRNRIADPRERNIEHRERNIDPREKDVDHRDRVIDQRERVIDHRDGSVSVDGRERIRRVPSTRD